MANLLRRNHAIKPPGEVAATPTAPADGRGGRNTSARYCCATGAFAVTIVVSRTHSEMLLPNPISY